MGIEIRVDMDELRKRKLMVAVPMYGGQCHGIFARASADLAAMCTQMGIQLRFYYLFNESLITRARNYCADEFMRSGDTHLMFIDSDIGFDPRDVISLLALQSDDSPYDVIAGPYPKKTISWEKIVQAVNQGAADEDPNELEKFVGDYVFNPLATPSGTIPLDEPVEVSEAGTGFMMIRRATFEMYDKTFPDLLYRPDHVRTANFDGSRQIMAYFDCIIDRGYDIGDLKNLMTALSEGKIQQKDFDKRIGQLFGQEQFESRRYLSEDYNFCYHVQKAGGKTWLCPWISLTHAGMYMFGGSLTDIARIKASPTADASLLKKKKR
jgi:hypothetical protein